MVQSVFLLAATFLPLFAAPVAFALGRRSGTGAIAWFSFGILAISTALLLAPTLSMGQGKNNVYSETYLWGQFGNFGLRLDGLSIPFAFLIYIASTIIALYSKPYMERRLADQFAGEDSGFGEGSSRTTGRHEPFSSEGGQQQITVAETNKYVNKQMGLYFALYLTFAMGMLGTVLATNLIEFYVFFELMLVPAFFMVALYGYGARGRTALMFFFWTHVGAVVLLLGLLAMGFFAGGFDYATVKENIAKIPQQWLGLIVFALFVGFGVKLAAFLLHIWLPHTYAQSPAPLAALISSAMTGIGAYGLLRLWMELLGPTYDQYSIYINIWGVATMVYGGAMALMQDDMKKVLAYSSISQMGYILFGLGSDSVLGISGATLLFVTHGLAKAGLFMMAGSVQLQTGTVRMSMLGGLAGKMPYTAVIAMITGLTLIGIPPTSGFMSEWTMFNGALQTASHNHDALRGAMFAVGIMTTIMSSAYLLWMYKNIFFGKTPQELVRVKDSGRYVTVTMAAFAAISLVIGVVPDPIFSPIVNYVGGMFANVPAVLQVPTETINNGINAVNALAIGFEQMAINGWLIWILPFAGAAIIPAVAKKGGSRVGNYTAVGFALASAAIAASLLPGAIANKEIHSQVPWIPSLGLKAGVLADPLAVVMSNLVGWISFLIIVYSVGYMHGDRDLTRYWFFMLFFIGSMQLIVLSDNLLMVFFGWEGVGLASYALVGFWYYDRKKDYVGTEGQFALGIPMWTTPTAAGIKAFLQTKAGDVMMLAGMFLIFAYSGTFGFKELLADQTWAQTMASQNLLVPAAILLFGGAIGKSAQFPLNEWLLEAMTGPSSVSALIHAATMVKAGVFLVARIGPLFFALSALHTAQFFEVVAWVGAITSFMLATQALVSPEIKKVLAYSTGSQIGYMMMALGIAGLSTNFVDGYTAGFFHLMSHAMFKASLFMGAGALLHVVGSRFLTDMGGMKKHMPKTYIFMLLSSLSLAGAPLVTSGFWSKDAIFASLLESGYTYAIPLFITAALIAVMTAFYTFRMVGMAFFGKPSKHVEAMEKEGHHLHEVKPIMWVPFAILAVATVAIGVVGFVFEAQIHALFSAYLGTYFGIHNSTPEAGLSIAPQGDKTVLGLNPIAAVASVGAFGVGGGLGYLFYIGRKADPIVVSYNVVTRGIWIFLYKRWYLNSILYWGAVYVPLAFFRVVWRFFETNIIDGINPAFQYAMSGMSKVVKAGQTGITQTYIFVFGVGIMIVVMLLLTQR